MVFDTSATFRDMLDAGKRSTTGDWPLLRASFKGALDEEKAVLRALAEIRIAGEIDDDTLDAQLREERKALEAQLLVFRSTERETARAAAGAAMTAFREAVLAATNAPRSVARGGRAAKAGTRAMASPPKRALTAKDRRLNARPDTVDFRDLMYVPTLVEVGQTIPLAGYQKAGAPILDQGQEGACTGFGLAAVVHYLQRTRKVQPNKVSVSPRMLYALARRYDEWPGEAYEGSSCRGAMKGWHKHGVCAEQLWHHDPANPDFALNDKRSADAQARPLGAYFRVNHRDLVAMHAAISEVGVLYASGTVHSGWDEVTADGAIPFNDTVVTLGGHAFALVAYDELGFWIQNSWGAGWGLGGFARISYEDWLKNGSDVWVARLGVPITLLARSASVSAGFTASSRARAYASDELRPHVVSLGNDGQLRPNGAIGTSSQDVRRILREDFPRITKGWKKHRLVLYAHGGLVGEEAAVQRVSEYRAAMLDHECYPLAFIWKTDYWTTLKNMLEDALCRRRTEGVIDAAKDFMLDRLDDALEPLARKLTGKAAWDEMKENALAATQSSSGGARLVADEIAQLAAAGKVEIHVVGHSAGSIFGAPLVHRLTAPPADGGLGMTIDSCTLWAPACTMGLFDGYYLPAIDNNRIGRFALYTLTDRAEQADHCAHIYNKSLLYLVSNAFEARPRIPLIRPNGVPLLGMASFVERHVALKKLIQKGQVTWIQAPNTVPEGAPGASASSEHGGFDDDKATVASTLAFVLGEGKGAVSAAKEAVSAYDPRAGASGIRAMRSGLERAD
jgi:hypothetical protein